MKLADEQLKGIVKFWQSSTASSQATVVTTVKTTSTTTDRNLAEESAFLQFMKRVDRELTSAQNYLYNVTGNIIGSNSQKSTQASSAPVQQLASEINSNTRFSPIPIQNNASPAPIPAKDASLANTL